MAFTFLTVKDFVEISRVAVIMASENNLFSFSKIILRELGLKALERCVANVSVFSFSLLAQFPFCFLIGGYYVYAVEDSANYYDSEA